MDFASVTDITTPAGPLERIQRGGVTIWEKSRGTKYKIRKDGVEVARVTIPTLQRMIGDGTAQSRFGIGAQLVLPYTYSDTEYECPMNFGTFRTFTKEDGTTFTGLGLESVYGLSPEMPFDICTDESSRWKESSLRRYMNAQGTAWPEKSVHAGNEQYSNYRGMLDNFPADFVAALAPVRVSTRVSGTSTVDVTYDLFFPLSNEEKNISTAEWDASLSPASKTPAAGVEGTAWEYWIQKIGDTPFIAGNDKKHSAFVYEKISGGNTGDGVHLRTRYLSHTEGDGVIWMISTHGYVVGNYFVYGGLYPVPACVLPAL